MADDRTAVWVKDEAVAAAMGGRSTTAKSTSASSSFGGNAVPYSPGRRRMTSVNGVGGLSGTPAGGIPKRAANASTGWGWTRACIISSSPSSTTTSCSTSPTSTSSLSMSSNNTPHKMQSPYRFNKSNSSGLGEENSSQNGATGNMVVLLITDKDSPYDNCTVTIPNDRHPTNRAVSSSSSSDEDGNSSAVIVMANTFDACSLGDDGAQDTLEDTPRNKWSSAMPTPEERHGDKENDLAPWKKRANGRNIPSSIQKSISVTGTEQKVVHLPPDDLITLTHLHEPAVVHCLRERYAVDKIYTATGPILLALNPFKDCGEAVYGESVMRRYWERGESMARGGVGGLVTDRGGKNGSGDGRKRWSSANNADGGDDAKNRNALQQKKLPPHVYATADDAFRSMMRNLEDIGSGIQLSQSTSGEEEVDGSGSVKSQRSTSSYSFKSASTSNSSSSKQTTSTLDAPLSADQSILVSGESGAGKTVTTKIIMQYLAMLSRRSVAMAVNRHYTAKFGGSGGEAPPPPPPSQHGGSSSHDAAVVAAMSAAASATNPAHAPPPHSSLGGTGRSKSPSPPPSPTGTENTEQQVLESNPILESFGNARTIRNDNSSRFGKFIELQFTSIGTLVGAHIDTYLLEKVRLISQSPGERNYHIFYEILVGTVRDLPDLRREFFLDQRGSPEFFKMTSCSGTYDRRDGVKDETTFRDLMNAMDTMGFTGEEKHSSLSIVSALLHASNLTFIELDLDESRLDDKNPSLEAAVTLLGVTADDLDRSLCQCTMDVSAAGETLTKTLSLERATKALEALIKATYGALFTFLVQRINSLIACRNGTSRRGQKAAFIAVLDIFGFESFDVNSFEQLCINYCNEALQQQFNRFVFKLEQQEYQREGITWSFISFPDNQDVLDLIDAKRTGILPILDDLCLLSKNTDEVFASAIQKKCSEHPRFESTRTQKARGLFAVHHYAGVVEYSAKDFLEKNKDELPKEATDLLLGSSDPFVQLMGYILSRPAQAMGSINPSGNGGGAKPAWGRKNSLVRVSVGAQFCTQLSKLRRRIDATSPHYIRCLKPNDDLVPDRFDPAVIVDQLRCGGILEAVRVSRVGYPHRYQHHHFVERYRILALKEMQGLGERVNRTSGNGGKQPNWKSQCGVLVEIIAKEIARLDAPSDGEGDKTASPTMRPPSSSPWSKRPQNGENDTQTRNEEFVEYGIQMGKSKVFLRRRAFDVMEHLRGQKREVAASTIASVVRMFLVRLALFRMFPAVIEHEGELPPPQVETFEASGEVDPSSLEFHSSAFQTSFEASLAIARGTTVFPRDVGNYERAPFKWVNIDGRWVKNDQYGVVDEINPPLNGLAGEACFP